MTRRKERQARRNLELAAPGTTLAHAPGVSASQAGAGGSLAEVILRASAWIENYCQQGTSANHSLFALSRAEKWGMPGRRAAGCGWDAGIPTGPPPGPVGRVARGATAVRGEPEF